MSKSNPSAELSTLYATAPDSSATSSCPWLASPAPSNVNTIGLFRLLVLFLSYPNLKQKSVENCDVLARAAREVPRM
jgi:hypothetical protein